MEEREEAQEAFGLRVNRIADGAGSGERVDGNLS